MLQTFPNKLQQIWQQEKLGKKCPPKMNDRKSQNIKLPQGANIKLQTSEIPLVGNSEYKHVN